MSFPRLLFLFLVAYISIPAQVMNVRKWRPTERDSLDNALAMVDESYYLHALPIFGDLLQNHPKEQFLKYSYAKCALHRGDKQHESYDLMNEIYDKSRKIPDIQFDMALAMYYKDKFEEAATVLDQYTADRKTSVEGKQKAARLKRYISYAKLYNASPGRSTISALGEAVNSEYDEYAPAISYDGSALFYTYAGPKSQGGLQIEDLGEDIRCKVYREDVFVARRRDKRFQAGAGIDSINTLAPEQVGGVTADAKSLLVYQDISDGHGDLYLSRNDGTAYTDLQLLKGKVNGYSRETWGSLSPDGKTLYFASDRSDGYGGLDIYRASLSADSTWTNIRNLGDSVNSLLDEDTPFMCADGVTLFFSSKGRTSMGGFDVFVSRMNSADSAFLSSENLGTPVNGTSDDLNFVLSADGKTGFFSTARKAGMGMRDIYQVTPQLSKPIAPVYVAKGKVKGSGKARASRIDVEIVAGGSANYTTLYTDSVNGEYLAILQAGKQYRMVCSAVDFSVATVNIDTRSLSAYTEKTHDFELRSPTSLPLASAGTAKGSEGTGKSGVSSGASAAQGSAVSSTTVAWPDKDGFIPQTLLQKKTMRYIQRYGDVSDPDLEFRVQFAAAKGHGNVYNPRLSRHGKIERLNLGDGYTRITVGGGFKTLKKAFAMNKKAINAGQPESFVIALYKGKRIQYEELEKLGVFH